MPLTIRPIGDAQPIQFAASELASYIQRICPGTACDARPDDIS